MLIEPNRRISMRATMREVKDQIVGAVPKAHLKHVVDGTLA
jgi:hypothetical protein